MPMKNILSFALSAVLSGSLAIHSQHASASDLWEIYQLALLNDPTFQAAQLEHEATELNYPLAKSNFRPALIGTGEFGRERSDVTGTDRTSDESLASLNAELPLYDKPNRIEISQSQSQIEASALLLENARHDLMLRVADRYFNILGSMDAREVARVEKIAIQRQMDLASERLEVGLGTQTDFFDAKARFKQAEANEIRAQNVINNNIASLKQIIGVTPEALDPLSADAPLDLPEPNDIDAWVAKSLDSNVPLLVQALNTDIALDEIDRQKSARMPTLGLAARYTWRDQGSSFTSSSGDFSVSGDTTTAFVGLALNFPLYLGGSINLRTEQAGILYNREDRLLEESRRLASTETTSAFLDVTSGVSQVEALFEAISAGESALEAKEEGFSAGLTTNLDVLDAQRDLSSSRTDYLRARYTYILSVLELERAAGQLNEEDIKRVNSWLE